MDIGQLEPRDIVHDSNITQDQYERMVSEMTGNKSWMLIGEDEIVNVGSPSPIAKIVRYPQRFLTQHESVEEHGRYIEIQFINHKLNSRTNSTIIPWDSYGKFVWTHLVEMCFNKRILTQYMR